MSALLSDNLLLFAWSLSWLLMASVAVLFVLICAKHFERHRRYQRVAEIDRLLAQMADPELFRETNTAFHVQLRQNYDHHYLDLLYAWTRRCQQLAASEREIYCNNAARCGLFDHIPVNLRGTDAASVCIALEACGLAGMTQYTDAVERYSWVATYAPFACHALVRMSFEDGMESLFRAYGHGYINNGELLTICSEYSKERLVTWAEESMHWPLPEVLRQHWVVA